MGWFRGMTALAVAAALAPFIFFFFLGLSMFGLVAGGTFPVIMAFVAWMILSKRAKKEQAAAPPAPPLREEPLPFPTSAYTPPVHFDLLLEAKEEIGRIRGAATAIRNMTRTIPAPVMAIRFRLRRCHRTSRKKGSIRHHHYK